MQTTIIVLWTVCGVVHHALSFAYYQGQFPRIAKEEYWKDLFFCLMLSLFGPVALFAHFWCDHGTKHGFKLW